MRKPRRQFDFGPYKTPRFRYGATVQCQVRGEVVIVGISTGRIAWPLGRRRGATGGSGYVVYKDLAKAIRRESARAIQHWFGLGHGTVSSVRKSLGVSAYNEGTRRSIQRACRLPQRRAAFKKAQAKANTPEVWAKAAAARRGKPRPRHVIERLIRARHAQRDSEATRLKRSELHKKRGSWPPKAGVPWTAAEDALALSKLPNREVAAQTGRTYSAVRGRRHTLRVLAKIPHGSRKMREEAYARQLK